MIIIIIIVIVIIIIISSSILLIQAGSDWVKGAIMGDSREEKGKKGQESLIGCSSFPELLVAIDDWAVHKFFFTQLLVGDLHN